MNYPNISKQDCDNCINRNKNHDGELCLNTYSDKEVVMSKKDFHMYQKALKDRDVLLECVKYYANHIHVCEEHCGCVQNGFSSLAKKTLEKVK